MPTAKIETPIRPGYVYHIYNRGHNYRDVFTNREEYELFLEKMKKYMPRVCSIYAFVLVPNHFHMLLRINENTESTSLKFSRQYSNMIVSYTNLINHKKGSTGSIFQTYFRRLPVTNEDYLRKLVFYINHNPCKHRISSDFKSYPWSSYRILISQSPTLLKRDEVLSWFSGRQSLIEYHDDHHKLDSLKDFMLEE